MTKTFGLDLLEAALTASPALFAQQSDFAFLLRDHVCALLIRMYSPFVKVHPSRNVLDSFNTVI